MAVSSGKITSANFPNFLLTGSPSSEFNESNSIEVPDKQPRSKIKFKSIFDNFEHSHNLKDLNTTYNKEHYECVECSVKFDQSDHLLQHLDTHEYFKEQSMKERQRALQIDYQSCKLCDYSLGRTSRGKHSAKNIMENHVMVEHFNAKIPSLLSFPMPKGINSDKSADDLLSGSVVGVCKAVEGWFSALGVWRCGICPKSFDQLYQRRIHER